jgi:hypothetical protein
VVDSFLFVRRQPPKNVVKVLVLVLSSSILIIPSFLLTGSFDDEGNLSAEKFTVLGQLRREAESLRGRIVQILQSLLRSQDMKEKIADRYSKSTSFPKGTVHTYIHIKSFTFHTSCPLADSLRWMVATASC